MNLERALQAVEEKMAEVVSSDVPVLQEASRHIIAAGGKRIRPRIMALAYMAAGGKDLDEIVPVAAAVELVHTATLVHDDINDHGVMRRGRVTINEKWGRTFALLTGDFLFTKVYELMAPYKDLNITLAEATVALVEGETLQAAAAKENNLTRDVYQQVVAKKTASLFRAAAMLGVQLASNDDELVEDLGEYGFYLGLAFQIVDDLLDLIGDPGLMGKAAGVDTMQGKGVATAINRNGGKQDDTATIVAPAPSDDPIAAIKRNLIEKGAVEEGRIMARATAKKAHQALDNLPQSVYVDELRAIIQKVLDRDK